MSFSINHLNSYNSGNFKQFLEEREGKEAAAVAGLEDFLPLWKKAEDVRFPAVYGAILSFIFGICNAEPSPPSDSNIQNRCSTFLHPTIKGLAQLDCGGCKSTGC